MQASQIGSALAALHANAKTVLVAIDGAGGSGKSFLARSISRALKASSIPACIVEGDDFFLPSRQRPRGGPLETPIGGDYDWPRLRDQVIEPLRRGQSARYERYDWLDD